MSARVSSGGDLTPRKNAAVSGLRVAICLFGVIARSIRRTWASIEAHVVKPLQASAAEVQLYVFNNDVGENATVYGVKLSLEDVRLVPHHHFEQRTQASIDEEVARRCATARCRFRADYSDRDAQNALRQLFAEARVGEFLRGHVAHFDVAVVIGPDILLPLPLPLRHVELAAVHENVVYTSMQNDADGYTDGLYIGRPKTVATVLRRLDELARHMAGYASPHGPDFEGLLKAAFDAHGVRRAVLPMVFLKVRASGEVEWQGKRLYFLSQHQADVVRSVGRLLAPVCSPYSCFPEAHHGSVCPAVAAGRQRERHNCTFMSGSGDSEEAAALAALPSPLIKALHRGWPERRILGTCMANVDGSEIRRK